MALAGHFSRMKMWRGRPETSGAPWCCEPGFSRTQGPRAPPTVAASTIPRLFMKRPPGMATRAGAAPREGSVAIKRLIERCAGLDVHKKSVTACVRVPGPGAGERTSETRTFSTTTAGLLVLRDWLTSFGVTVVGMESTGVLWKPVFYLLEDDFDCWLLNAQHLRNVPGRKTPSMSSCGGSGCLLGEPLGGPMLDRVVGHLVDPAAPDHPNPGASKDAGGVGMIVAAGDGVGVDLGGPGAGQPRVV